MNKKRLLCVMTGILFFISCSMLVNTTFAKEPIKIGVILGLSGYMAEADVFPKMAVELYMETHKPEINGRPVKFIIEDDGTDPAQTMDKMRKLIDVDGVCMTIGPTDSGCATSGLGYAERMKVPNIAISAHAAPIPMEYKWVWLPRGIDYALTYSMGNYIYDVDGARTAVGLYPDFVAGHDTADGFRAGFEGKGGKVLQEQFFPPDAHDFAPFLSKLKKADALVGMFTPFSIYRQIEEFGIKTKKYVYFSTIEAPAVQKELDLGEGWNAMTGWSYAVPIPGAKEFGEAFRKKFGEYPYELAGEMWSNIQLVMDVLRRTNGDTSSKALAKALNETSLNTISGPVKFGIDHIADSHFFGYKFQKVGGEYVHKVSAEYVVKVTGRKGKHYDLKATRIK